MKERISVHEGKRGSEYLEREESWLNGRGVKEGIALEDGGRIGEKDLRLAGRVPSTQGWNDGRNDDRRV